MSKKYYLCPIIGDGTSDNTYRVKMVDSGLECTALIPSFPEGHPRYGHPMYPYALCIVNVEDHSALMSDPELSFFPDQYLDTEYSKIPQTDAIKIDSALSKFNIPLNKQSKETLREIIEDIGKALEPKLDIATFNVK